MKGTLMNKQAIEQVITAKNLKAPRVSLADLEANIAHVEILKHESKGGQILRWAILTTISGYAVTGRPSASISPENDNQEVKEKAALDNAYLELWVLMGYVLKEQMHKNKDKVNLHE